MYNSSNVLIHIEVNRCHTLKVNKSYHIIKGQNTNSKPYLSKMANDSIEGRLMKVVVGHIKRQHQHILIFYSSSCCGHI